MNPFDFVVSLRIRTPDPGINPDDICAQLALTPKWLYRKGAPRKDRYGIDLGGVYQQTYCTFPLDRLSKEELPDMLMRVTGDLLRHKDLFSKVRASGGRSDFFVGWYSVGNTGATLDCALLKCLGDLSIDLDLDIYGDSPDASISESIS